MAFLILLFWDASNFKRRFVRCNPSRKPSTVRIALRTTYDSMSRSSPSTFTDRDRTGWWAGPWRTAPEVTSNWLPWHGHVTVVPSSSPSASEHPLWGHVSSIAYRWPCALAMHTLVPATSTARISFLTTSFAEPTRTNMTLPPCVSRGLKRFKYWNYVDSNIKRLINLEQRFSNYFIVVCRSLTTS